MFLRSSGPVSRLWLDIFRLSQSCVSSCKAKRPRRDEDPGPSIERDKIITRPSHMTAPVDLYNNAYSNAGSEIYAQIRVETYGHDLGQTSWVTAEESHEIPKMLHLRPDSSVLELG